MLRVLYKPRMGRLVTNHWAIRKGVGVLTIGGGAKPVEHLVDAESVPFLRGFQWHQTPRGYANTKSYRGRTHPVRLHAVIMNRVDADDGLEIDHINRNKQDSRRSNLRVTSSGGGRQNMPWLTAGATGVSRRPTGEWQA